LGFGIINGCGKVSPVGPQTEQDYTQQDPYGTETLEHQFGRVAMGGLESAKISTVIDRHGGVIDIITPARDFETSFIVPSGSLSEPVTITIDPIVSSVGGKEVFIFDFGPSGTTFDPEATLEMRCDALALPSGIARDYVGFDLYWFNPAVLSWQHQQYLPATGDVVEFDIDHFSRYGIGGRDR
ncbi:MAG: hypothetical protein GY865_02800, partial [candidate division Zixibacteria bacterium]|nr:hypothetical protein [candidate division Zixibacteria bacterium]